MSDLAKWNMLFRSTTYSAYSNYYSTLSHGQLYVVVSRVTSRERLKILITNEDDEDTDETSNIVYEEVFRNVRV